MVVVKKDHRSFVTGTKACGVRIMATTGALGMCTGSVVAKAVKANIGPTLQEPVDITGYRGAEN